MITKNKTLSLFIISFFTLWLLPFPLYQIPYLESIATFISGIIESTSIWVGTQIFNIEETINPTRNGSGDKLYDYVLFYSLLVISLLITIVLELLRVLKKININFQKINYWFFVYLRLYLFTVLLSYGLAKVFPLQFREPGYFRLLTNFGDFSPMGLEWTYMGFSRGYTFLAGILEVIGALLLLHRRTMKIGAVIISVVMFNVAAVNIFYDVPVKLYALRYLSIAILLLLPDLKRILQVFFDAKTIEPHIKYEPFKGKLKKYALVFKWVLILLYLGYDLQTYLERDYTDHKPINEGLYKVTKFERNGDEIPPLVTDSTRVNYISIERYNVIGVMNMPEDKLYYRVELDTLNKKYLLKNYRDSLDIYSLTYSEKKDSLFFSGTHKNDTIQIHTVRLEKSDFLIYQRPFTWINDRPFNR